MEKWVVKNITETMLNLPELGLFFRRKGEMVDLVSHTGMSILQLESNAELNRNISYNHIATVEKIKTENNNPEKNINIQNLENKIDSLLTLLLSKNNEPSDISKIEKIIEDNISKIGSNIVLDNKEKTSKEDDEEEKMRENAIKKLVENSSASEKNMNKFGDEKTYIEDDEEDLSDMIDF